MPLNTLESSFRSQLIGCKHRACEGVFYIGGSCWVLCQFIEPVRGVGKNLQGGFQEYAELINVRRARALGGSGACVRIFCIPELLRSFLVHLG